MDSMSRTDPIDQGMPDTSGMQDMQDMQDMRNGEGLTRNEGGIADLTSNKGNVAGMTSQGTGLDSNSPDQQALNPDTQHLDENDPNVARDPVCGMLVDKRTAQNTLASPVNEQMGTVYFCSANCKAIFEEDPQRYGSNF